MKSRCELYQTINTMGMSQLDLILKVYAGAIAYLRQAQADFAAARMMEGTSACDKARTCVVHLYTTLNMDKGGEIARHLGRLYAFMIEQIDLAAASASHQRIDEVIGLLNTVKEAWDGLKSAPETTAHAFAAEYGIPAGGDAESPSPSNRITVSA